ncbi:10955_t:CDS:1, partial [Entrophospora sp. SA101]
KSLLSLIDRKTSLLRVLLEVYNDYAIRKLLKIDWNSIETRKWRNDILARFLHHPKFSPSKHKPNALYDAFTKADVLEPEHILILAR